MKNNEIYNVVKIKGLALNAITPKLVDAFIELNETTTLNYDALTLNVEIKCQDAVITSKYHDDCYDKIEYITTKICINNKIQFTLDRDMYEEIVIA